MHHTKKIKYLPKIMAQLLSTIAKYDALRSKSMEG